MKLWLVRHAQPVIAPGICYGATDVAADEQATWQAAHTLARTLPPSLPLRVSSLRRCGQLAQVLSEARSDLRGKTDARLAEMNFGGWEGQRWDAIPQADYERWTADFGKHRFGGQESVQEFVRRVAGVWDETLREGRDAVWITHAGVIRAATLIAQGVREVTQAAQWPQDAPGFGCWCVLES